MFGIRGERVAGPSPCRALHASAAKYSKRAFLFLALCHSDVIN